MTAIVDTIKLPRHLDRRVKISEETKEDIKWMYKNNMSQRMISRLTDVSRRMVSFILFPEREAIAKQQFKERRLDGRYDKSKEDQRKIHAEHRAYKKQLLSDNLIHRP